jgi:hypothetical protein
LFRRRENSNDFGDPGMGLSGKEIWIGSPLNIRAKVEEIFGRER